MTETNLDHIPRYAYEGGFRAAIIPDEKINLKIVGMGFEARDTSEVVHEEHDIPWNCLDELRRKRTFSCQDFIKAEYITTTANYRVSAKNRLDFLVDACGFPAHLVLDFLPMTEYTKISKATESKILDIILKNTANPKIIYGEIIGGHIKTWEHSYNTPMIWF